MKEIKAVLQPHIVSRVVRALHELPHFPGLTLSDARGQGRGRGAGGSFKLTEDDIDYHRKVILEVVCNDDLAASITETIRQAAHTGNKGDGIILVSELQEVIRIRSGEKQNQAV
jgi:nitrogen regulatory protein P-II 1